MDSGIEIFWPNYKVGTRQNFSTRQRIKKNLTLTLAQWDLKATLKFSQNHELPWSGVFEEFAVLDFVAWPERWNIFYKRWTRQPLTLTDVLYGSDICMDKWTINNVTNRICSSAGLKNQQCFDSSFNTESLFVSIDMHEEKYRVSTRCLCKSMHPHLFETHTGKDTDVFQDAINAYPWILLKECVRYCSRTSPNVNGIRWLTERETKGNRNMVRCTVRNSTFTDQTP